MTASDVEALTTARRAEHKVDGVANVILEQGHQLGRIERELRAVRSELRVGLTSLRETVVNIRDQIANGAFRTTSILEEDWQESPTGTHMKVSKKTFEKWQRENEITRDGRRWRKALDISGKIALRLVGAALLLLLGWMMRHYLGKP